MIRRFIRWLCRPLVERELASMEFEVLFRGRVQIRQTFAHWKALQELHGSDESGIVVIIRRIEPYRESLHIVRGD